MKELLGVIQGVLSMAHMMEDSRTQGTYYLLSNCLYQPGISSITLFKELIPGC